MTGKIAPGRHLVAVVDETAAATPDKPLFSIPRSPTDASLGWEDITYGRFSNAVNRVTQYLLDTLGGKGDNFPTFAYVGYNDTRYAMVMIAGIKAGYKALLISPRNSIEGQVALFESSEAIHLFYGREYQHLMEPVIVASGIPAQVAPTEQEWLDPTPVKHFALETSRPFDQVAWDPVLVLHTSGSTGIPKPIVMKLANFVICDAFQHIRSSKYGRPTFIAAFLKAKRLLATLPLFHAGGILMVVCFAIYYDMVSVLPSPLKPITADTIIETDTYANCDSGIIAPAVLQDLSHDEGALKRLRQWKSVLTGGGPTSDITAEQLRGSGIHAMNVISATETVPLPLLESTADEFPLFCFAEPELGGLDWRKVPDSGSEEIYELWIKRLPDWSHQAIFHTFPHLNEFDTRDIFRKVPGKEGLWQYYARSDDVIVFSNGEKLNPIDIESAVGAHPLVKGAVVVGQSQFQAALLIEPREHPADEAAREKFIDEIWPCIEEINQETVTHGVIMKKFITLTTPDKPLPLAGKGTVQRAGANKLYESEVKELYARVGSIETEALDISLDSEETLLESLIHAFETTLELRGAEMTADADLYSIGIDSMQILTMSRNIKIALDKAAYKVDPDTISPRAIYKAATLRNFAHTMFAQGNAAEINGTDGRSNGTGPEDQSAAEMKQLVTKFTADLPSVQSATTEDEVQTYLITGTSGAMGPYLLNAVLASSPAHVFAMNRDPTAAERQLAAHESRGLSTDFSRVTFLKVDVSRPDFGLDDGQLAEIKESITRIIDNAWPVNFNIPLSSFVPSITGVRHLIDLAAAAVKKPHTTFTSSVGTVGAATGHIKETAYPLDAAFLPYGQSKAISSAILDAARAKGFRNAIVRVGQVAGPMSAKGQWKPAEWFPTLVASSAGMGLLPADIGPTGHRVDWVPVEAMAGTMFDISKAAANGYYHAVNPAVTSYAELLPEMTKYFRERVKVVELQEWIAALKRHSERAKSEEDIEKIPGIKLLDFYQGLATDMPASVLETEQTIAVSKSLRDVGPIRAEWMQNWLRQWAF